MKTYTIYGRHEQHIELIKWAHETNEKMLEFIGEADDSIDVSEQRPIIVMPEKIDAWFEMNCFLWFIKEYYFERNGRESIYGGQD